MQQASLKTVGGTHVRDGEKLLLGVKDVGTCEIYPQTMQHSPSGRFVAMCGDGEYIIYTAMALRNKGFGSAQGFVWAQDSSQYAIREDNALVKIFKNFKQTTAFKTDFEAEGVFGGFLLGVKSQNRLFFYDWESAPLIRCIKVHPKHVCHRRRVSSVNVTSRIWCKSLFSPPRVLSSFGPSLARSFALQQMSLSLCCATGQRRWRPPRIPSWR